ncbi:MAG: HD domain-containing protein [Promethearchaeota archaeon]
MKTRIEPVPVTFFSNHFFYPYVCRIPVNEQIIELYQKYQTPLNIQAHQRVVATVAVLIGSKMQKHGLLVNVKLVRAAAFLHDIGKLFQINKEKRHLIQDMINPDQKIHHAEIGKRILIHEGYPEVGHLVNLHVGSNYIRNPHLYSSNEARIMLLSDLRVLEDKICSIEERMDYIEERYGLIWGHNRNKILSLEKSIFSTIGLDTKDLEKYINQTGLENL